MGAYWSRPGKALRTETAGGAAACVYPIPRLSIFTFHLCWQSSHNVRFRCSAVGKRERVREEGDKRGKEDQIKMRGGDLVGVSTVNVSFVVVAVNFRRLRSVEFESVKQESDEISRPGTLRTQRKKGE